MTDTNPASGFESPEDRGPTDQPYDFCDSAGTVIRDAFCRRCGYNLRTLHRDGRCPECGTAVGLSVHGDLLRYADPQWVEQLSRGGTLVIRGLTILVISYLLLMCGSGVFAASSPAWLSALPTSPLFVIASLWFLAVFSVIYYGVWLITTPDPAGFVAERQFSARRIVRIAILVCVVGAVIGLAEDASTGAGLALSLVRLVAAVVGVIGVLAYLRYGGKLAERVPDRALTRRAAFLFKASVVLLCVFVAMMAVGVITAARLARRAGVTTAGVPAGTTPAWTYAPSASSTAPSGPPTATTPSLVTSLGYTASSGAPTMPVTGRGGAYPGLVGGVVMFAGCFTSLLGLILFFLFVRWQAKLGKAFKEQAAIARATWAAGSGVTTQPE